MQISSWQNIAGYTKMLNHPSIQESRVKDILPACLGRVFTVLHTYLPSAWECI